MEICIDSALTITQIIKLKLILEICYNKIS